MSENYYLILELDPAVVDPAAITAKIEDMRRAWSLKKNQGSPSARRVAERYLKLVPEMHKALKEPQVWRTMAIEAAAELKNRKQEVQNRLEEFCKNYIKKRVDPEIVKMIGNKLQNQVSEAEILACLKRFGAEVGVEEVLAAKPRLEPVIAKNIADHLTHLKLRSLYEFLGADHKSSPRRLAELAEEIYRDIRRRGLTDADATARGELAGLCKTVFADDQQKQRYDTSLGDQVLMGLDDHLDLAGIGQFLDQEAMEGLIVRARQLGVSHEQAEEYVRAYAAKRNWRVVTRAREAVLLLCGLCKTVARTAADQRCYNCGQLLIQSCPCCGKPCPTQDECCTHCGASAGDAQHLEDLMREGERLERAGDLGAALTCYRSALSYWPTWSRALQAAHTAETKDKQRMTALDPLEAQVKAKRFVAAQLASEAFAREFGALKLKSLKPQIELGLNQAQKYFTAGETHRKSGDLAGAFEAYESALNACVDFEPALRALDELPPPAPGGLSARLSAGSVQLTWNPVKAVGKLKYVVVRKQAGPPASQTDGELRAEVETANYLDRDLPGGRPWFYSVFAKRAGVCSAAVQSKPILRLLDPKDIRIDPGENQITLSWTLPEGCRTVEVWREQNRAPMTAGQGRLMTGSGNSFQDSDVRNGSTYGYLLCACYNDPCNQSQILRSSGVALTATPIERPSLVEDLRYTRQGRAVSLRWNQPQRGRVQIRRTTSLAQVTPGQLISLDQAQRCGEPVPGLGELGGIVELQSGGTLFFVPLTVVQQSALIGVPVAVTMLDGVSDLKPNRSGNHVQLTWNWPAGAKEVLICWRPDRFPNNGQDAEGKEVVTLDAYRVDGYWTHRGTRQGTPKAHYFTVFVQDPVTRTLSEGVSVMESSGVEVAISYCVVAQRRLWKGPLQQAWIELSATQNHTLPPLAIVLKEEKMPLSAEDGVVLVRLPKLELQPGKTRVDLPLNRGKGYVKLFFQDSRFARQFRLLPGPLDSMRLG